jgi:hemolysin activation/secretion protein
VEKFALGFQPRLRGYVPYEVEGDRGIASTLELSYVEPIARGLVREVMPFAFAEAGAVETVDPQPGQDGAETLYSVGGGIRLQIARLFSAAAWVGVPLVSGPYSEAGDPAFYLRLSKAW